MPAEERAHPRDQRRSGLEPEWRTGEVGVLALRDGGEIDLTIVERKFGGRAKDGCGCLFEDRILLVLNGYLPRPRKESVGTVERNATQVVVDRVVAATGEGNAVDEEPL